MILNNVLLMYFSMLVLPYYPYPKAIDIAKTVPKDSPLFATSTILLLESRTQIFWSAVFTATSPAARFDVVGTEDAVSDFFN